MFLTCTMLSLKRCWNKHQRYVYSNVSLICVSLFRWMLKELGYFWWNEFNLLEKTHKNGNYSKIFLWNAVCLKKNNTYWTLMAWLFGELKLICAEAECCCLVECRISQLAIFFILDFKYGFSPLYPTRYNFWYITTFWLTHLRH